MSYPHKIATEYSLPYYPCEGEGVFLMSLNIQHTPESDAIQFDVWVSPLSNAMAKAFDVEYEIVIVSSVRNEPERIRDIRTLEDSCLMFPIIDRLLKCFYKAN